MDKKSSGRTVITVIISTDKTQLSVFSGDKQAWPIYLTIGNISKDIRRQPSRQATVLIGYLPIAKFEHLATQKERQLAAMKLFHECMGDIFEPMEKAGRDGVRMACADGCIRLCHPILFAYVADFPEQCLIGCCKQNRCPNCEVLKAERGNFDSKKRPAGRKKKRQWEAYKALRDGKQPKPSLKTLGLHRVEPFWLRLPYVNPETLFTPDILHQLHKGNFRDHLVKWCENLMTSEELDTRYKAITPFPGLRHFKKGISFVSQWSGNEYKNMEKVFLVVLSGAAGVPDAAMTAATALVNFIYLARYPVHTDTTLGYLEKALIEFHKHKDVFLDMPKFGLVRFGGLFPEP